MSTFKKGMITEPGRIEFVNEEKRVPEAKEVLIKIYSSAICGSDMHIYRGKHPYVKFPTSIGHEIAGVVEAVGSAVTKTKVGDRVTVEPLITCGECYWCRHGRYDYCENLRLKYRSGFSGYAEYYYVEEDWIRILPDSVSFDEGSLMEPFACTIHAVMKARIQLCDRVCVIGDGPIGLLLARLSVLSGATRVFVAGLQEKNLKIAEEYGCIPITSDSEAVDKIIKATDGRGVDVSFEAVGIPSTFNMAMKMTRKGGKAIIFGIFEDEFSTKSLVDAMVKELEVIGTSSYCWDFERAIELASSGKVDLKPLITDHYPLDKVNEAMSNKNTDGDRPLKIILHP